MTETPDDAAALARASRRGKRDYRAVAGLDAERMAQAQWAELPDAPCGRCGDRGWCKHRQPDPRTSYGERQALAHERPSQPGNVG